MDFTIPRTHDEPPKLLLWDFDQALVFMVAIVFGIMSDFLTLGVVIGIWVSRWYGRAKAGKHRMYVVHLMYWYLPSEWLFPIPSIPPSSTREFIG